MTTQEQMLRVPRVATMLDVTKKRVYQMIHERRFEAVRLGPRQTRILKDSLEEYVEGLRRQERITRGEEMGEPPMRRHQDHRVNRARRPPQAGRESVERFFGERKNG